jgi:alkyl hydroperoxide reductase subunit AhpC
MAGILDKAPELKARAVRGMGEEVEISREALALEGKWLVLLFYPRDFTPVCPTEVLEVSRRSGELRRLGAEPIAISVDDIETHRRWIAERLGEVAIPLAADPDGRIARAWGVFLERERVAARATFLVDPGGVIQYAAFHPLSVGRSVSEILRVLEALLTGELAPAEWQPGTPTLGL